MKLCLCKKMDGTEDLHIKWSNPVSLKQVLHVLPHMWSFFLGGGGGEGHGCKGGVWKGIKGDGERGQKSRQYTAYMRGNVIMKPSFCVININ